MRKSLPRRLHRTVSKAILVAGVSPLVALMSTVVAAAAGPTAVNMGALTPSGMGDYPYSGTVLTQVDKDGVARTDIGTAGGVFTAAATWGPTNCLARTPYTIVTTTTTYTVTAVANAYHIGKSADWAGTGGVGKIAGATLAGKTGWIRSGVLVASGTTAAGNSGEPLRRAQCWSGSAPFTLRSEDLLDYGGFTDAVYLNNTTYVHFKNLAFNPSVLDGLTLISNSGALPCTDIFVEDCTFVGAAVDPLVVSEASYLASGATAFSNKKGIVTDGSYVSNIKVTGCYLKNVQWGISLADVAAQTGAGNFCTSASPVIVGNHVDVFYEIGIRVGVGFTAAANNSVVTDNVVTRPIAKGTDFNNPHGDAIGFFGNQAGALADANITCHRNIVLQGGTRGSPAPIAFRDLDLAAYFFTGSIIGNVINLASSEGLVCQNPKAMVVKNNTVTIHTGGTGTAPINIGSSPGTGGNTSSGVHVIEKNICDYVAAGGSPTLANNVELTTSGWTVGSTLFGPTFTPATRAEALAQLTMLVGGHADLGLAVEAGAIGSGAVNWATVNPSSTAGSNNVI